MTDIFNENSKTDEKVITDVLTVHDALERCVDRLGRVDLPLIGSLAKASPADVLAALRGSIYYDPEKGQLVTSDEYLSGNIMIRLKKAKAFKEKGGELPEGADMDENIAALEAVMPKRIEAGQIKATIGSPWIPTWVYRDFIIALIGIKSTSGRPALQVEYIRSANHYIIRGKSISLILHEPSSPTVPSA